MEIKTDKAESLSENLRMGLRYIGKAMQDAEEICQGDEMGQRGGMGYRGNGHGMGMRGSYRGGMGHREEEEEYDEYGNPMGMRRGRRY